MFVGVCRVELFVPESDSLKAKRFVVRSLKKRIRNKFNVSVSEIGETEKWQIATLGLSTITNERKLIDKTMGEIFKLINRDGRAEIINQIIEIY